MLLGTADEIQITTTALQRLATARVRYTQSYGGEGGVACVVLVVVVVALVLALVVALA